MKYAFPGGRPRTEGGETECRIDVELWPDGKRFTLVVADNGVGLPPGLDWTTTPSLGLQLINVLARHQLAAHVEVDTQAGTAFKITFAERRKEVVHSSSRDSRMKQLRLKHRLLAGHGPTVSLACYVRA